MNFVYPSYRPSLQRSPSDPQPTNVSKPTGNLFYPYMRNATSQKIGRFTITPVNSKPVQKFGRFTVTNVPQKVGRFTIESAPKGGRKSKKNKKKRSLTRKSR